MITAVLVLSHFYGMHGFSDRQIKRMNKAINVFKETGADYIIGTGGFGFFNRSEIALGKRTAEYIKSTGIPDKAILFEAESRDTIENFSKTLPIITQYKIEKIVIITSWDHMFRAKFLARRIFPKSVALEFIVSDYHSTWKVTIWDFFWHLGGWIKLGINLVRKKVG